MEFQEAKTQVERLNPGDAVDVEIEGRGDWLPRDDIPASSMAGVRIVLLTKFGKVTDILCKSLWGGRDLLSLRSSPWLRQIKAFSS